VSNDIVDTVESERFHEIMQTKKRVLETRGEIQRATASGKLSEGAAIGLYQKEVRDYIMSVETVLDPADGDTSPYWEDRPVGDFHLPDGEHKTVNGLNEFLDLPETFEVEVERQRQQSYRHAIETVSETRRVRPPKRLVEHAFQMTNRALDAAGLDLNQPTERSSSTFKRIDDVEKATKILEFLQQLDDDGLRELKQLIDDDLLGDGTPPEMNGHHE
jgi:hypothetical protein